MTHLALLEANQQRAGLFVCSVALTSIRHLVASILQFLGTILRKQVSGLRFFSMAFIEFMLQFSSQKSQITNFCRLTLCFRLESVTNFRLLCLTLLSLRFNFSRFQRLNCLASYGYKSNFCITLCQRHIIHSLVLENCSWEWSLCPLDLDQQDHFQDQVTRLLKNFCQHYQR